MLNVIKSFAVVLVLASTLFAKDKKRPWIPNTFKATFEKVSFDELTEKEVRSKGTLFYKHPKRLRFESKGRKKIIHIFNPFNVYYYTAPVLKGNPGELVISKAVDFELSNFFDLLRTYGVKTNKNYKVNKKGSQVSVTFNSKAAVKYKLVKANLSFSSKKHHFKGLNKLVLTLDNGNELNYELKSVDTKAKITNDTFVFEAPKNTNITRN